MPEPEPLEITCDTTLEPGTVLDRPVVIRASGVVLDGRGAILGGPGRAGSPDSVQGTGISANGCSGVTLRNLAVRGWRVGLEVRDGTGWVVEDCDFSDNFTNPDAGWNCEQRLGGIVLTRVCASLFRRNTAQRVWNALDLRTCHYNTIVHNTFSRCSNVCLKLWTSCRNRIAGNDLSYGLRLDPGEVHARDSAGVLIESGSDYNTFVRNDVTHGGDGIFLRSLNGWVSTGNVFVGNDCSHANNNGFEAWSPGNVFLRNRASHCSYGYWFGGSDRMVLLGNEAAWNGCPDGNHNAPEKGFGHGGIVFVGAPASHTIVRGNHCHHNHGAGIALRGDAHSQGEAWRAFHWVIEDNRLEHNRWGVHAQHADLIHMAGNAHLENEEPDFLDNVTRLTVAESPPSCPPPIARLDGPERATAGERVAFDASRSRDPSGRPLTFAWYVAGAEHAEPRVERVFSTPGFYRVAVTVSNGERADLASRDVYVVAIADEIGTEGHAAEWMHRSPEGSARVVFADVSDAIAGAQALEARVEPCGERTIELRLPASPAWDLSHCTALTFWLKRRSENIPGFEGPSPVVCLRNGSGEVTYTPSEDANRIDHGENPTESRWGWLLFTIPLEGDAAWVRWAEGSPALDALEGLAIRLSTSGREPFTVWLDGLAFL